MPAQEHRRVINQPQAQRSREDWEQLRRSLLMIVAQFKASDPQGCYTIDVRLTSRDRVKTPL